jgi:hypothetical protein
MRDTYSPRAISNIHVPCWVQHLHVQCAIFVLVPPQSCRGSIVPQSWLTGGSIIMPKSCLHKSCLFSEEECNDTCYIHLKCCTEQGILLMAGTVRIFFLKNFLIWETDMAIIKPNLFCYESEVGNSLRNPWMHSSFLSSCDSTDFEFGTKHPSKLMDSMLGLYTVIILSCHQQANGRHH